MSEDHITPEWEDPVTLAWAQAVSREVQAAHAEGRAVHSHDFVTPCLDAHCPSYASGRFRPGPPRRAEPAAPADPAAEIQAVLREYDAAVAAGDFTLPDAPARAPGTCEYCYGPVGRIGGTVCRYCQAGGTERLAADRQPAQIPDVRKITAFAPPSVRARRRAGRKVRTDKRLALAGDLMTAVLIVMAGMLVIAVLGAIAGWMHP
jgi:hypothetical protein